MPTILLKKSDTPGSVPGTANLTNLAGGVEVAVNTADKRVYSMTSASAVIELGTNPSSLTCADVSATVLRSASATITNLIATSASITTLTNNPTFGAGTANGVLYLNGSKVATSGSALTFDGTNLGVGTASPAYKLDVLDGTANGNVGTPIARVVGANQAITSETGTLSLQSNSNMAADTGGSIIFGGRGTTASTNSVSYGHIAGRKENGTSANFAGYLQFGTSDSASDITERMRLDSSGNLGLGVTPSAWSSGGNITLADNKAIGAAGQYLNLSTNWYYSGGDKYVGNGYATLYYQQVGAHKWYTAPNNTSGAGATLPWTTAMTLDASGQLGIGTTSPSGVLDIRKSGAVQQYIISTSATSQENAIVSLANNGAVYSSMNFDAADQKFKTSGTERARITSGGYFKASNDGTYVSSTGTYHELRSTTNNSRTVSIHSAASNGTQYGLLISTANDQADATRYFLSCEGGGVERATIRSNGGLANYSANDVNLASDERLKKDISPLNTAWDKVKDIEVVNYRYKDCNEGDPLLYGVIAQQVQPIVPELVVVTREAKEATEDQEATPEFYGIREQPMYWLAIKALQEAMARIESLEAKVTALEAK